MAKYAGDGQGVSRCQEAYLAWKASHLGWSTTGACTSEAAPPIYKGDPCGLTKYAFQIPTEKQPGPANIFQCSPK